jgi:hypothetical protein
MAERRVSYERWAGSLSARGIDVDALEAVKSALKSQHIETPSRRRRGRLPGGVTGGHPHATR